eukprot:754399-Hanusia_phi.AAC.2
MLHAFSLSLPILKFREPCMRASGGGRGWGGRRTDSVILYRISSPSPLLPISNVTCSSFSSRSHPLLPFLRARRSLQRFQQRLQLDPVLFDPVDLVDNVACLHHPAVRSDGARDEAEDGEEAAAAGRVEDQAGHRRARACPCSSSSFAQVDYGRELMLELRGGEVRRKQARRRRRSRWEKERDFEVGGDGERGEG